MRRPSPSVAVPDAGGPSKVTARIALVVRPDWERKPGGDVSQALKYVQLLAARGISAEVVAKPAELEAYRPTLVHLFNLDAPVELVRAARLARDVGVPHVISPIAHPRWARALFFQNDRYDRFNVLARRVGMPLEGAAVARGMLKHLREAPREPGRALSMSREARALAPILESAAGILCLARAEAEELQRSFPGLRPEQLVVLPNGFDPTDGGAVPDPRDRHVDIAVVGRVEPRKNQLLLAQAAAGTGRRVVFAGPLNDNHPRFARDFQRTVDRAPNLDWVGPLDRQGVHGLLSDAKVHYSTSWFEVQSLVDIEAVAAGCFPVPSRGGYTSEYVENGGVVFDPLVNLDLDPAARVRAALDGPGFDALGGARSTMPSWDEVGDRLVAAYADLGQLHR